MVYPDPGSSIIISLIAYSSSASAVARRKVASVSLPIPVRPLSIILPMTCFPPDFCGGAISTIGSVGPRLSFKPPYPYPGSKTKIDSTEPLLSRIATASQGRLTPFCVTVTAGGVLYPTPPSNTLIFNTRLVGRIMGSIFAGR